MSLLEKRHLEFFVNNKEKFNKLYDSIINDALYAKTPKERMANRSLICEMVSRQTRLNMDTMNDSNPDTLKALVQSLFEEDLTFEQMEKFNSKLKEAMPAFFDNIIKQVKDEESGLIEEL